MHIDLSEEFEHLPAAPIVEAVIHFEAKAERKLTNGELQEALNSQFPEYLKLRQLHELYVQGTVSSGEMGGPPPLEWAGIRAESDDGEFVVQFHRTGVVFSRLQPHATWEDFQPKAMKAWNVYCELARPSELTRLGVRFINKIALTATDSPWDYLTRMQPKLFDQDLSIDSFLHQEVFNVVHCPYKIRQVQTLQPAIGDPDAVKNLILDIHVFTGKPIDVSHASIAELEQSLAKMRWLKNKTFIAAATQQAINRFQEPRNE